MLQTLPATLNACGSGAEIAGGCSLQEAAQRHLDFSLGLFADPVFKGDYPDSVRLRVPKLPKFTLEEQQLLKGSADYFAL